MTNFLFLQNSTEKYSPSRVDLRFHKTGFKVDYYWAYQNEFPAKFDDYRGVFISGSPHGAYETIPWIDREHEVIQQIAELDIPTLGVCFGSQILASTLCGRDQVFRRNTCEVGYLKVDLFHAPQTDPLLHDLADGVDMFIWHNDEVRHQHPDIRVIGSTDDCPNQIWRYRDKPIWGIQGHPELTRQQARQVFKKNRTRLQEDGADVDRLIREADETVEAKKLIDNFIKICVENR